MVTKEVIVNNSSGLESKEAAKFIQKASSFCSQIWVERDERKANAKSLLGLLSLSIARGTKIMLVADGNDENEAIEELCKYIGG